VESLWKKAAQFGIRWPLGGIQAALGEDLLKKVNVGPKESVRQRRGREIPGYAGRHSLRESEKKSVRSARNDSFAGIG
jgi:hypothetical protein